MIAVTRAVPASLAACELTHLERAPIDVAVARAQHEAYEAALRAAGCAVERLPADDALPDSVFVEDTAVVVDELAVIARPGAASRRPETLAMAALLARHRPLVHLEAPATLDGGDVLRLGRELWVGLSSRTNEEGVRQLAAALAPHGYRVQPVRVEGCLHLKSAVTQCAEGMVVLNPSWIDRRLFGACDVVEVDDAEPYAANVLYLGDVTLCASAFPRTNTRLAARGIAVQELDAGELAKAEGALTCCSVLIAPLPSHRRSERSA